jgi:site-specific DNA-methyltransferase (adenine-specific)
VKPYCDEGGITIYHGDCREILPELAHESVTLLWTDPPYGHGNHVSDFNARLNTLRGLENKPIANDGGEEMREVVDAALQLVVPLLRQDCCCCCCCCCGGGGPRPTFAWLAQRMDCEGLEFFHSVIWDKVNPGLGWRYRRQHEMVMVAHRKGGKLAWADEDLAVPNVISLFPNRDRQHPNEKPVDLSARFVEWHTRPGELVLDPFMGSGTTLRAAKDAGRSAIGIEVDERYCEIAAARMGQEVLDLEGTLPRQKACRHIYDVAGCDGCQQFYLEVAS